MKPLCPPLCLMLALGLVSLARAGSISGTVYGPGRGTKLNGVTVSAYTDAALVGSTTTGADGVYLLDGLAAGAYRVEYFDPRGTYARAFYQDQPHFWGATVVTVGSTSAATGIDAVMTYATPSPTWIGASDGAYTDRIRVVWRTVPGARYYRIFRSATPTGPKTAMTEWSKALSFNDRQVVPGKTYYYFVRAAYGASGQRPSAYGHSDPGYCKLDAPARPWASIGKYTDRVTVSWPLVRGATWYRVYRATTATGAKTPIGPWQTSGFFHDRTAVPGKTYYYFVQAAASSTGWRHSSFSAGRSGYRKLDMPAGVWASSGKYVDRVTVSWHPVPGASAYRVFRSDSATGLKTPLGPWQTACFVLDRTATPGRTHFYFIQAAVTATGWRHSSFSSFRKGWRALAAPMGIVASDGRYKDRVVITWTPVARATHYRLYRAASTGGPKTPLGSWRAATSYSNYSATPGVTYYYFVRAATSAAGARPSGFSSGNPGHRALAAPTGLWTSAGQYTDRVTVSWHPVLGAGAYRVFRAETATGPQLPMGGWQIPLFFLDGTAQPGKTYYYFVQAAVSSTGWRAGIRGAGRSGWRALAAPAGITVLDTPGANGVTIAWQRVDGASHYRVSRADTPTGVLQPLGAWQTGCAFLDLSALPGRPYYYAVQGAVNASGLRPGACGHGLRRADHAAVAWYVDASRPDDSGNGGAWETACKTLQAAVSLAADGDTVWVANGRYAPITTDGKALFIASVNGAAATAIDGQGVDRCATLGAAGGNTNTVLTGFTLVNGAADFGGAAYGGTLDGCVLASSRATVDGGGAFGGVLNNCLVCGNAAGRGGGVFDGTLNNCTVTENRAQTGGGIHGGRLANCIVWGNTNTAHLVDNHADATFLASCTTPLPASGTNNLDTPPQFVDAAQGDWRLAPGSPCIDTGDNSRMAGAVDLDRHARIQGGTVDMGAYEYAQPGGSPGGSSAVADFAPVTAMVPVAVPLTWLDHYRLVPPPDSAPMPLSSSGTRPAAESAAAALADADGDGFAAWQEFVAGSDPTNAASHLKVKIGMEAGRPRLFWTPDLGDARRYTLEGKITLGDPAWIAPPPPGARFFRVSVNLP